MADKEETMKCIVETTGRFMLLNTTSEEIPSQRPSVTTMTPFVDVRINKKELKVLARNLPRKANDADFKEVLVAMEGNKKAAVAAYAAEFGLTIDGEPLDEVEVSQEEKARLEAEEAEKKAAVKEKEGNEGNDDPNGQPAEGGDKGAADLDKKEGKETPKSAQGKQGNKAKPGK